MQAHNKREEKKAETESEDQKKEPENEQKEQYNTYSVEDACIFDVISRKWHDGNNRILQQCKIKANPA